MSQPTNNKTGSSTSSTMVSLSILIAPCILLLFIAMKTNKPVTVEHHKVTSTVNVQSQNTSLCYEVITHFNISTVRTKNFSVLTKITCPADIIPTTDSTWNFTYIAKSGQCLETLTLQQEVFPGSNDRTVEITAMAKVPCEEFPTE